MTGAEQSAEASHVRSNSERTKEPDPGGKSWQLIRIRCSVIQTAALGPDLQAQGITSINRPGLILYSTFIPQRIPKAFRKNALLTGRSVMGKTNREIVVFITQAWNLR